MSRGGHTALPRIPRVTLSLIGVALAMLVGGSLIAATGPGTDGALRRAAEGPATPSPVPGAEADPTPEELAEARQRARDFRVDRGGPHAGAPPSRSARDDELPPHPDVVVDGRPEGDAALPVDPGPDDVGPAMLSDEGFEVVAGGAVAGDGSTVTYTVEVEPELDEDPLAVTAVVEEALHDPRSWASDHRLERVDDPADATIRVVLARPATVDRLCAQAGLDTAGIYSCWNGRVAALNAMRWDQGAPGFDDLDTYRRYLVNHEFGHGLGYGHVGCPTSGELAPVMMQQTMGTDGCVPNGWVYPEASPEVD